MQALFVWSGMTDRGKKDSQRDIFPSLWNSKKFSYFTGDPFSQVSRTILKKKTQSQLLFPCNFSRRWFFFSLAKSPEDLLDWNAKYPLFCKAGFNFVHTCEVPREYCSTGSRETKIPFLNASFLPKPPLLKSNHWWSCSQFRLRFRFGHCDAIVGLSVTHKMPSNKWGYHRIFIKIVCPFVGCLRCLLKDIQFMLSCFVCSCVSLLTPVRMN